MFPILDTPEVVRFHETWGNRINVDKGQPWVCVSNPCQHITSEGLCDDYESRPIQCKNFPHGYNELYAPHCKLMRSKIVKEK